MSLKPNEVISNIQNALITSDLFESSTEIRRYSAFPSPGIDKRLHSFLFPRAITLDSIDGFKLKNDKGYVSIKEVYEYENQSTLGRRIQYIYRYVTSEYLYDCTDVKSTVKHENIHYRFHYDMDMLAANDNHPLHHIQVIHPHPRLVSKELHIWEFLQVVKRMCYEGSDLAKPYQTPIYLIK